MIETEWSMRRVSYSTSNLAEWRRPLGALCLRSELFSFRGTTKLRDKSRQGRQDAAAITDTEKLKKGHQACGEGRRCPRGYSL